MVTNPLVTAFDGYTEAELAEECAALRDAAAWIEGPTAHGLRHLLADTDPMEQP